MVEVSIEELQEAIELYATEYGVESGEFDYYDYVIEFFKDSGTVWLSENISKSFESKLLQEYKISFNRR